jgi:uncharacterized membrane protein YidH (DUF202 family)
MSNDLYNFVQRALEKGQGRGEIQRVLAEAGWQEEEIQKALSAFADVQFAVPVPKPKPYLQAREAFLYLISFITLYITAFSFGALVFAFIGKLFPDPLQYGGYAARGLTTSLAALIVAFPLYAFMTRLISKAAAKDPERRQSKVGKWLTYITLVVAAGIIIGDLIAVLSNLLGGELTARFILKALTILVIAGSIFGYYLWNLQKEEKEKDEKKQASPAKSTGMRIFSILVAIIIAAAVVYGLTLVGTPVQQRLIQFDERRVSDLQQITFAIDSYWERNKKLPEVLEDLRDPRYYLQSITDPKTDEGYDYHVISETDYELCAVFETDSSQLIQEFPKAFSEQSWDHGAGRTCFELEVRQPLKGEPIPVPAR